MEETGKDKAKKLFIGKAVEGATAGTNCCQAVICAYSEQFGVSAEDAFRMTEGFGLGMGGLMDTCGAVTGMFLTIGLANSESGFKDPLITKKDTYDKVLYAASRFREQRGSLYCRDLKTEDGPMPLDCCTDCVCTAAGILDEMLPEIASAKAR